MRQKSDKITMLSEYQVGEEVATVHIQDINQPATILDVNPELHIKCIDVLFSFHDYSLWNTTVKPMNASITVLSQGYSASKMVT